MYNSWRTGNTTKGMKIDKIRAAVIDFYTNGDNDKVKKRIQDWFDIGYEAMLIAKCWDDECIKDEYSELKRLKYITNDRKRTKKSIKK